MNSKKKFLTRFFYYILFSIKIPTYCNNAFRKYFICFEILTKNTIPKCLFFTGFSSISHWVFNISKNGFPGWNCNRIKSSVDPELLKNTNTGHLRTKFFEFLYVAIWKLVFWMYNCVKHFIFVVDTLYFVRTVNIREDVFF